MDKEILDLIEKVKSDKASKEEILIVIKEINSQVERYNDLLREVINKF